MTDADQKDLTYLRQAFEIAREARQRGDGPFGALLVDGRGDVLLRAGNTVETERDCTGHAETSLVREAYRRFEPQVLSSCTLYASAEPCAMCAAAIFWSGIGRVVFGMSSPRIYALDRDSPDQLHLRCADVLAAGKRRVEVIGPLIEDEAAQVFEGYFDQTRT
jgi:tRNA(adenine34) deaminase